MFGLHERPLTSINTLLLTYRRSPLYSDIEEYVFSVDSGGQVQFPPQVAGGFQYPVTVGLYNEFQASEGACL